MEQVVRFFSMKVTRKIIPVLLLLVYFAVVVWFILNYSYPPQSYFLILLFLFSNFPSALIIISKKSDKELLNELKFTEKALRETYKHWDSLLSLLPQAVFGYANNTEGNILFVNDFGIKLFGYNDLEDFKKMGYLDIFDSSQKAKIIAERDNLIERRSTAISEYVGLKKDGTKFPVALYSTPIMDAENKVSGVLGILIDLSEVKRFKETIDQLHSLDKAKDDFLNIAAHELKTPLTSILVVSELLKTKTKGIVDQEIGKEIDLVFGEAERLKKIVDQILTATRFENKHNVVKNQTFDLLSLIKSHIITLNSLAEPRGSHINFELTDGKEALISADPDKILEVLNNFVDNAVKYGTSGQTITVKTILSGAEVRLEISDQGAGIEPEKIGRIFSKFSQLENSLARTQEGIGLGLYISRLIIESYKGHVGVESVLKKGSTFYFSLPLIQK
ncbi:MAG: PAS domain-containing sensor histidine kinase [Candidatus Falkowbacteria bacterium]